jgi:N-acetylmuramoyl-L-alanine amidase
MRAKTRRLETLGLLAAVLVAVVGCEPQDISLGTGPVAPPSVQQMHLSSCAARLGMRVAHRSRTSATLRNGANTVVLYSEPLGEVYVNGTVLPDSGGIAPVEDSLLVPVPLVSRLAGLLRSVQPPHVVHPQPPHRAAPSPPRRLGCVVIDPGHGGRDPGAISCLGSREKDIVLRVSKLLAAELRRANVDVRLTRTTDRYLELEDRPAVANRCGAHLFISVHADSARNRRATGFTAYVSRSADAGSLAAADAIGRGIAAAGVPSRGIRRADFRVLVYADSPAVLVELGYLSNRWEAVRLNHGDYQQRLARALARGVTEYLAAK